jgi:hypothetical protein
MIHSDLTNDIGNFLLAAFPVGGLLAQITETIPSGWKDLGVAGCALAATVTLWLYLKKKDDDQNKAQIAALVAKDDEIKRLNEQNKALQSELFKRLNHDDK